MKEEFIKDEIASDESIKRIIEVIRQQVIRVFQEYQAFNKNMEFFSNINADIKILEGCVSRLKEIRVFCVKELGEFSQKYTGPEKQHILEYLRTMIKDLEDYDKNLEIIIFKLANDTPAVKERFREEMIKRFNTLFEEYKDFIAADEKLIATLTHLKKA